MAKVSKVYVENSDYRVSSKKVDKINVEGSNNNDEKSRAIKTTFTISPYALNLIDMLKDVNRQGYGTYGLVGMAIVESTIDELSLMMAERMDKVVEIRNVINTANIVNPDIDLSVPKIELFGGGTKKQHITTMILSKSQTEIKRHSEPFLASDSAIFELLVYLYFRKYDKYNNDVVKSKVVSYCESSISRFLYEVDSYIDEQTQITSQDTLETAFIKLKIRGTYDASFYKESPDGESFRVVIKRSSSIHTKSKKRHGSRGKASFRQKSGRKTSDKKTRGD